MESTSIPGIKQRSSLVSAIDPRPAPDENSILVVGETGTIKFCSILFDSSLWEKGVRAHGVINMACEFLIREGMQGMDPSGLCLRTSQGNFIEPDAKLGAGITVHLCAHKVDSTRATSMPTKARNETCVVFIDNGIFPGDLFLEVPFAPDRGDDILHHCCETLGFDSFAPYTIARHKETGEIVMKKKASFEVKPLNPVAPFGYYNNGNNNNSNNDNFPPPPFAQDFDDDDANDNIEMVIEHNNRQQQQTNVLKKAVHGGPGEHAQIVVFFGNTGTKCTVPIPNKVGSPARNIIERCMPDGHSALAEQYGLVELPPTPTRNIITFPMIHKEYMMIRLDQNEQEKRARGSSGTMRDLTQENADYVKKMK